MKERILLLLSLAWLGFAFPVGADNSSPVGLWRSIDDKTGKPAPGLADGARVEVR